MRTQILATLVPNTTPPVTFSARLPEERMSREMCGHEPQIKGHLEGAIRDWIFVSCEDMTGWSALADAEGGLLPPFFNRRIEQRQWTAKGRRQEMSEAERGITFTRYIPGILHCSLWGSWTRGRGTTPSRPSVRKPQPLTTITSHDGGVQAELRSFLSIWVKVGCLK